jgi:hypothetical protein
VEKLVKDIDADVEIDAVMLVVGQQQHRGAAQALQRRCVFA